ncbi:hypothetical protein LINGRAHAP2_LOCUS11930, partial [Linum grandiflorum]
MLIQRLRMHQIEEWVPPLSAEKKKNNPQTGFPVASDELPRVYFSAFQGNGHLRNFQMSSFIFIEKIIITDVFDTK